MARIVSKSLEGITEDPLFRIGLSFLLEGNKGILRMLPAMVWKRAVLLADDFSQSQHVFKEDLVMGPGLTC